MLTFLATFAVFVLVIFGMSLGWIIKRKSIQGSCGGISSIGMEKVCDCPEPCDARKKRMAREQQRIIWSSWSGKATQPPDNSMHTSQPSFVYCILIQ